MKKIRKYFSLPLSILIMVGTIFFFAYQNCGKIALVNRINDLPSLAGSVPPFSGKLCTQAGAGASIPKRYLFIIDMSGSNITVLDPNGAIGSDINPLGQRFEAIKAFINSTTCITAGSSFAAFGFSGSNETNTGPIIKPNSTYSPTPTVPPQSCGTNFGFKTGAQITTDINAYKAINNSRHNRYSAGDSGLLPMGATQYDKAFRCAASIVNQDLFTLTGQGVNPATAFYEVFFVTDGAPSNDNGNPMNTSDFYNLVLSAIKSPANPSDSTTLMGAAYPAANLKINTFYYGAPSLFDIPNTNDDPKGFLQLISDQATLGNPVNQITDLATFSDSLCQTQTNPLRIGWGVKGFGVVNVNSVMRKAKLVPDRDADGLSDDEELALGFDQTTRRTAPSKLLDSICNTYGGVGNCQPLQSNCNATTLDNTGLSECDRGSLGLNTNSFDSDNDGIPDLIEILKGTDPHDAKIDYDFDHDGFTDAFEIFSGRNPVQNEDLDGGVSDNLLTKFIPSLSANQQCMDYTLQQVPIVQTGAYFETTVGRQLNFSHDENENVLFIYLLSGELNGSNPSALRHNLQGFTLRVKAGVPIDRSQAVGKDLGVWP